MRRFEVRMVVASSLGLCFLADPQVPTARADFTFGPRVHLGPAVDSPQEEGGGILSPNGLELYFYSTRSGGYGLSDGWVSKRASTEDPWGLPVNLGPGINGADYDSPESISSDGLTLYLGVASLTTGFYLDTATRPTVDAPWGPRVRLSPVVTTGRDFRPIISDDDLELYFGSSRAGGLGSDDIYVSTRATPNDPWGLPVNLGPTINTARSEGPTAISPDGLILFIGAGQNQYPGALGGRDTYMARRPSKGAPWSAPVNLGPSFNTPNHDRLTSLSADGRWAYLGSGQSPTDEMWMAPILPIVDFNGDAKVDEKDLLVMTQHWGQDYPLYDVGPFAWGDGVVDGHDWAVLLDTIGKSGFVLNPKPDATEVPRDVVLTWTAPEFAKAHDVYFGASLEDVRDAGRNDPRGVLVSRAQTATTYDFADLLEYGRTYYWRVDFVVPGPTPTIYQGPVLPFTTEAFAYPIQNVTATPSSMLPASGPEKTVDGSGLDKDGGHSTEQADMWWSLGVLPNWIQYEFDRVYSLHELWVWNFNLAIEPAMGFGAKTVKIEYSPDGTTWTALNAVPEFARAPGQPGYVHNTTVSFGGVPAKLVKLTIEKNWAPGPLPQTGLSEVRFFYIPTASTPKP